MKGKAKSTIDGFPLTGRNYKEALDLSKARFWDNKLLQASFIDSLLKLHKNIETYIRNLKSLQIIYYRYVCYHADFLHYAKFTSDIGLEITKNKVGDNWDFDQVLKLFNFQFATREKC